MLLPVDESHALLLAGWCRSRVEVVLIRILPVGGRKDRRDLVGKNVPRYKYLLSGRSIAAVCLSFVVEAEKDTLLCTRVQLGPGRLRGMDICRGAKKF